jgi:hypothetical protein
MWKDNSASIKILALRLMLAGRLAALCWALWNAVFYTEELTHSWCTDHLYKHSIYCSVPYLSCKIFIQYVLWTNCITADVQHWDVKLYWQQEACNFYRQSTSVCDSMAPSRMDRIEILSLDVINEYANQWDIKKETYMFNSLIPSKNARFIYTEHFSLFHLPSTES